MKKGEKRVLYVHRILWQLLAKVMGVIGFLQIVYEVLCERMDIFLPRFCPNETRMVVY